MNLKDYGLSPGSRRISIVIEAEGPTSALAEIAHVAMAFRNGEQTFSRTPAELFHPSHRPFDTVRRLA